MTRFPTFRLTRYFSALSLILILIAGAALGWSAQIQATAQMREMAQRHNEAMGQVFINNLWPDFSSLVIQSSSMDADRLRQAGQKMALQQKTSALMSHSNIIKVKVYNLQGLTVFSSDPRQIGESKQSNAGFMSARAGTPASELTHRNQFDSFEGARMEVDVIASYLPVVIQGQVNGVLEVYQDVTPFVKQLSQVLFEVVMVGCVVFLGLYCVQLFVVRYAQGILHSQEERLLESNRTLDARVAARTSELAAMNAQLHEEVAERRRAEARLDHLAHHDPLTGLPNRLLFSESLQRSIANAERYSRQIGLLFIDLDRFKEVNDTLGHTVGDELLIEMAQRLRGHLRTGDLLSRLGGDEFVCVLENVNGPDDTAEVARKLIARAAAPITLRNHDIDISASIGISLYPQDGADTENLLRAADTAMYQAKKQGRNTYHFYTPEMTQHARERVQLDRLMRHAIANDEMFVHYQVKVALTDPLRPCGAEALARWNNPELGTVPPVRFIPIAEETGYIVELGAWVLRTACRQMALWRSQSLHIPKISVNLSVRQLEQHDIVDTVRNALTEYNLPAKFLELEITESVIMNADNAILALERLAALGVQLSVDDFGTGYSSLAYLKILPIDTLKIDRTFVMGIGDSQGDESIIRAVIGMAKSLHLRTVAEGVETMEQLTFLQREGCEQVQGYLLGKPMAAQDFQANWDRLSAVA